VIDFQPVRARGQAPTLVDQLVAAVLRAIEAQELRPGMSLPSVRDFARQYQVSTFTVASAYNRLVSLGWLAAPGRAAVLGAAAAERGLAAVGHLRGPLHSHQVGLRLAAGRVAQ
jgi:DNA-binding transcriptional MocR family regulator